MGDDSQDQDLQSKLAQRSHGTPSQSPAAWLLIVIDTDAVMANYPDPSKDQHHPTSISQDNGFLVATGTKVESRQRPEEVRIAALVGDTVCASAISGSDNFEDAVLLYGMARLEHTQVFSDFDYQNIQKSTVVPNSTSEPLPAQAAAHTFEFHQASVIAAGTEGYEMKFALHIRDLNIGQHILYGYFSWNLEIAVQG
jgi:hypothetical protein